MAFSDKMKTGYHFRHGLVAVAPSADVARHGGIFCLVLEPLVLELLSLSLYI